MSDHYDRYNGMEELLGTNLAEVGTDLVSKRMIDVEGLDEEIRCEICRNPIRTNRGCDGNCTYDEKLYEKIMQILDRRIKQLPSAQPEVKQISYTDCANAMLMMWMDKVLTDGEYNRIMDKLNEHEKKKGEDNE